MKYFYIATVICMNIIYSQPSESNFWEMTNGPFGQKITTIDILSQDSVIVGTDGAGVFLFIPSTSVWQNIYSDIEFNSIYSSIITTSKDILFTANSNYAYSATIIKINSDLNDWKLIETNGVGKFANINDSLHNFILLTTQWNGIFKSTDNGETWENNTSIDFGFGVKDIQYDLTNKRIIVATNSTIEDPALRKGEYLKNGILFSDDFGETYYNVLEGNIDNILLNQKGFLFAIFELFDYKFSRSFDNGTTWEEIHTPQFFNHILLSDSLLYGVNNEGFFHSTDFGNTWELLNDDVKDLISIKAINESTFFIGSISGFYQYSTITNEYTNLSNGLNASNIWTLFASSDNKLLAGGKNGTIYYTENKGENWKVTPALPFFNNDYLQEINCITETSSGRLFVGSETPLFYYSDNLTMEWIKGNNYSFAGSPEIWSMATNSKDEIYVGTSNEGIVIINDDASEFRTTPILGQYILSLDIDENDEVYAGSYYGTVFFTTENAKNWQAKSNGLSGLPVISVNKSNNLYASTIYSVHKYNEITQYWDNIGGGLPPSIILSKMIVVDNTIYVSSRGNGIYYTSDEGKNWKAFNTGLENINITAIVNDSTGYLYVASMQGIYRTNDRIVSVKDETNSNNLPDDYILEQNYPNPFNPSTKIKYSIPRSTEFYSVPQTTLKVYDLLGNEIATLVNEAQKAGNYEVNFVAKNLSSGIYFYRLQSGSFSQTQKLLLLK